MNENERFDLLNDEWKAVVEKRKKRKQNNIMIRELRNLRYFGKAASQSGDF